MYYRRLLITCALCLAGSLLWGQSGKTPKQLTKAQQALLNELVTKRPPEAPAAAQPLVLKQAKTYLHAYYGRTNFNAPEWERVQNFLTWLTQNQTQLDQQFQKTVGAKWEQFSAEKQEVVLGAWLGMKYAVDQIGHAPGKQFPIVLEEKIWNTECGDYSSRRQIYCSKGDFVSKVNIALHEAVHLLPYLKRPYRAGNDFGDSYREKYTVAAQLRYSLPAKKENNYGGGTRSFFPLLDSPQAAKLLNEYAEGIAALIDYEQIWKFTPWPLGEDNSNESLDMRLRTLVFDKLGVQKDDHQTFYSFKVNNYFNEIGFEIAKKYCNQLPKEKDAQADYIHACFDAHQTEILALTAEKLRPLVSKQIPPVPKGYH